MRGIVGAGVASLLACVMFIALGVWQLHRLAWKEGLIAAADARAHSPPPPPAPPPARAVGNPPA
jgi:surfeit locus 1 family protein